MADAAIGGNPEVPMIEQKEGLKLMKMSKGWNWEIKLLSLDLDELERINTEMMKRFGSLS